MLITANILYRDTKRLFWHRFGRILVISCLLSYTINMLKSALLYEPKFMLSYSFPMRKILYSIMLSIKHMSVHHTTFLKFVFTNTLLNLLSTTILLATILFFVLKPSSEKNSSVIRRIFAGILLMAKVFIQVLLVTFLVKLGLSILIGPGILLFIVLSLSPIILIKTKSSVITSIQDSIRISWENLHFIVPPIICWGLANLVIFVLLFGLFMTYSNIGLMLYDILHYLLLTALIIWLYRLYTLLGY